MFNEERNAERCILQISDALTKTTPQGSLIIVNDGSKDATSAILDRLRADVAGLRVVSHAANHGYGAALVTGIREAHRSGIGYVLFMDADLTTDPKYISRFVEEMHAGVDVIKATRYSQGGGMDGVPLRRALISRVGNTIARILFGLPITDCTNGFRAVKTDLLIRIPFKEKAFPIIMEELFFLSAMATSFAEIPYRLTSRGPGQGVSRFVYRPQVFCRYLKYALMSRLRPPAVETLRIPEEAR